MRLIFLDYGGTLECLPDPVAFVYGLKAQGDMPILFTGSPLDVIQKAHPGLTEAVDHIVRKASIHGDQYVEFAPEAKELVFVDNEPWYLSWVADIDQYDEDRTWRVVPADQAHTLLGRDFAHLED